jgi:AcrR family transcriptional regulator
MPKAPKPPKPLSPSARDRIVEAATREFATRGFDGARMDALARRAGVNKALLYYYFPNKQELYRRLLLEHLEIMAETLSSAPDPASPPDQALAQCLDAIHGLLEARPFAAQFILREVLNGWGHLREEDFAVLFRTTRPIVGVVERGVADGTFRDVPPLSVHFLAVATLSFIFVSREARARSARAVGVPALAQSPGEFVSFLNEILRRGLAPGAARSPEPA